MTDFPAGYENLLETEVAALTTLSTDGAPQTTLIWFLHEDGVLRTSLNDHRRKTRNLVARPQVSLLLRESDWRFVDVRGIAEVEPDPDYAFAERLGAKYGGANLRELDGPGEARVVVTIRPTSLYAVDMRGR